MSIRGKKEVNWRTRRFKIKWDEKDTWREIRTQSTDDTQDVIWNYKRFDKRENEDLWDDKKRWRLLTGGPDGKIVREKRDVAQRMSRYKMT